MADIAREIFDCLTDSLFSNEELPSIFENPNPNQQPNFSIFELAALAESVSDLEEEEKNPIIDRHPTIPVLQFRVHKQRCFFCFCFVDVGIKKYMHIKGFVYVFFFFVRICFFPYLFFFTEMGFVVCFFCT